MSAATLCTRCRNHPSRQPRKKNSSDIARRAAPINVVALSEAIVTTEAKAKEVRGQVERVITLAKRGDLTARRTVLSEFPNEPLVINKLFDEIAPKYADRTSGFTRIVRIGQRPGDAAEIVQLELV